MVRLLLGCTRPSPSQVWSRQRSLGKREVEWGKRMLGELGWRSRGWSGWERGVDGVGLSVLKGQNISQCVCQCFCSNTEPGLWLAPHACFLFLPQFLRGTEASSLSMLQNLWSLILAPSPARVVGLSMSPPSILCTLYLYTGSCCRCVSSVLLSQ